MTVAISRRLRILARGEFKILQRLGVLPFESSGELILSDKGTIVYDTSGRQLFERIPFTGDSDISGYIDAALNPIMGAALLRVVHGVDWDEEKIVAAAIVSAGADGADLERSIPRFMAYAYPRVGIIVRTGGNNSLTLDCNSHEVVYHGDSQEGFVPRLEQWSLLDSLKGGIKRAKKRMVRRYVKGWSRWILSQSVEFNFETDLPESFISYVATNAEVEILEIVEPEVVPRCQGDPKWCIPASLEMIYEHHNEFRAQSAIAGDLKIVIGGLGLPSDRLSDVAAVTLDKLPNKFSVDMVKSPGWDDFFREISSERPLISVIPGHARVVVGGVVVTFNAGPAIHLKKLYVNDPNWCKSGTCNAVNCPAKTSTEDFGAHRHDVNFNFKKLQTPS